MISVYVYRYIRSFGGPSVCCISLEHVSVALISHNPETLLRLGNKQSIGGLMLALTILRISYQKAEPMSNSKFLPHTRTSRIASVPYSHDRIK